MSECRSADGDKPGAGHRAPLVELEHLPLVLAFARAVLLAADQQHHAVVTLELGQPARRPVIVWQLEVGEWSTGDEIGSHAFLSVDKGKPVDAGGRRDVESATVVVPPRQVVRRFG